MGEIAMQLYRFDRVTPFYERVRNYLLNNEAHHCLMLEIIDTLLRHPGYYEYPAYLATVEDQGR